MKTLIIHPDDRTTDELKIAYAPLPNKTIITDGATQEEIIEMIKSHDRIMMCGHGSPFGLMSVGKFPTKTGYVINESMVEELKKKNDSIFIWCYANRFVETHGLSGFNCDMFISEVGEAIYCGFSQQEATQELVDEAKYTFCHIMAKHINEPQGKMYSSILDEYKKIADKNIIAAYNYERLFLN